MSTFPTDLLSLARSLAQLGGTPAPTLSQDAAQTALQARAATLNLASRMIVDLGVPQNTAINPVEAAEGERVGADHVRWSTALAVLARVPDAPVASLGLLAHVEAQLGLDSTPPRRPTDLLTRPSEHDYEHQWQRVLGTAIAAGESWGGLAGEITQEAQWTVAANAASLAAAITTLDRQLIPAAGQALGRATREDLETSVSGSHLRMAALQVLDVASRGPLPSLDALAWQVRRGPVPVHNAYSLVEAQSRLPALIRQARGLTPADVAAVATTQALAHRLAPSALGDEVPARVERAQAIADHLTRAVPGVQQLRTLPSGPGPETDSLVRVQVNEMSRYLMRAAKQPQPGTDRSVRAMLDLAPAVIHAAHAVTARELREGRWLITYGPQPNLFAQRYPDQVRARGAGPRPRAEEAELPRLLLGLRDAGRLAGPGLGRALTAPAQLREASQAFEVLHPVARDQPADRPTRLGDADAPHARGLSLGQEHRERLRAIRERLSPTGDELREQPAGINTTPNRRPAPADRRQGPG